MIFTSYIYGVFLALVLVVYWCMPWKTVRNALLLAASYIFYGWIHPWFCYLVAASTLLDYACGLGMRSHPAYKRVFMIISLLGNLGMLGFFKYFNFFIANFTDLLAALGFSAHPWSLQIFLPVGISFYTFQTLSYTIDIYRGDLEPRRNFVDFALFVTFFPQLVAGPIERARNLLPQIEQKQKWAWQYLAFAWPLLIRGYLKKVVIADNVAVVADKVFMLQSPSLLLLIVGTLAFSLQIYADFSAYTDIARASAKLLGFDLMENFKSPYLAISPSDFWRRWHISFSSWIRDYLYIPLGGSRVSSKGRFLCVLLISLGLSGFWHGAAWHFVFWGLYHGLLIFLYHALGMGGRWRPQGPWRTGAAWLVMFVLVQVGWLQFRVVDMRWLMHIIGDATWLGSMNMVAAAVVGLITVAVYASPLFLLLFVDRKFPNNAWVQGVCYGIMLLAAACAFQQAGGDFIYFQF